MIGEQQLLVIEDLDKELSEILFLSSQLSERFTGIAQDIYDIAPVVGDFFGSKAQRNTELISLAVDLFGKLYAEIKKKSEQQKLLIKKQELASAKMNVLVTYNYMLHGAIDNAEEIFSNEIQYIIPSGDINNFETTRAKTLKLSYGNYLKNLKLKQVIDYIIEEYNAWLAGKHESGMQKPLNASVYDYVVNSFLLPEGLQAAILDKRYTAGMWLFENENILVASYFESIAMQNEDEVTNILFSENYNNLIDEIHAIKANK